MTERSKRHSGGYNTGYDNSGGGYGGYGGLALDRSDSYGSYDSYGYGGGGCGHSLVMTTQITRPSGKFNPGPDRSASGSGARSGCRGRRFLLWPKSERTKLSHSEPFQCRWESSKHNIKRCVTHYVDTRSLNRELLLTQGIDDFAKKLEDYAKEESDLE